MITIFSYFLRVFMCRYMSQQEQGLASTLNLSPSPLRSQQEGLYSFNQRGIWAWAFHLIGENPLQPHRSDLWWTFPLGKEGVCPLHQPACPKNHLQLLTSDSGKNIIHPLQFQPHSALLGAIAFSWKQGWWFTPRPGWSCRATGALQELHSPSLGGRQPCKCLS